MSHLHLHLSAHRAGFTLRIDVETDGPWLGIVGPSGSGKTTLLDSVAGLLPSVGTVRVGTEVLQDTDRQISLNPRQRQVGYVFQGEALFPHMTVASNLTFGMSDPLDADRTDHYREVTSVLDLEALETRTPLTLSGGERRRVALGRALLRSPRLLLLDEPLTGLDPGLRERVLDYLARCKARFKTPSLLVSHRLEDVLALADHIVVIDEGSVRAQGDPHDLVAGEHRAALTHLLGFENVLEATVSDVNVRAGTVVARIEGGPDIYLPVGNVSTGQQVQIGIRAEDIILAAEQPGPTSARNLCEGTITSLTPRGSLVLAEIDCGVPVVAKITPASAEELSLKAGSRVWFLFKTHSCHYLEPSMEPDVSLKEPDVSLKEPGVSLKEPDVSLKEPGVSDV